MKAIETRYKGYRFRSRLEARWAVFFDTLGLQWEYEREGFNLDGNYYLPDFWLPQVKTWAEVKGETFTEKEAELCRLLSTTTGSGVVMLDGVPEYKPYPLYLPDCLTDCYVNTDYLCERRFFVNTGESGQSRQLKEDDAYFQAVNAARGARFEHGENKGPTRRSRFTYTDDDESGECAECGRAIKACFRLCFSCKQAYEF